MARNVAMTTRDEVQRRNPLGHASTSHASSAS
jgi:hypothetical protein